MSTPNDIMFEAITKALEIQQAIVRELVKQNLVLYDCIMALEKRIRCLEDGPKYAPTGTVLQ